MFRRVIGRLFSASASEVVAKVDLDKVRADAMARWVEGDFRAAAEGFRRVIDLQPSDAEAHNNLGVCYMSMGDEVAASLAFETAYAMDETYLPAVVNYGRVLIDRHDARAGLAHLVQGWCRDPRFPVADAVYSGLCLNNGQVVDAVHFQLKAWLADFDSLRMANGYLFKLSYVDQDEVRLTAEHGFWAETLKIQPEEAREFGLGWHPGVARRLRIGYWSPDCRNHSVRYFFRPLLEGHDKDSVEIFVYHDNHGGDQQTELIKAASEHFHDVYALNDEKLRELLLSHDLDVLVELAGHTSANRLAMLQKRMARIQVTALGYPPTTGLASVDYKVLDPYTLSEAGAKYYAERPMVLPDSFWCFDPKEDAPIDPEPAMVRQGQVTFACVGNLAKISDRNLSCWARILAAVPGARLLIRSVAFAEPMAVDVLEARLKEAGFDLARVAICKPEGGAAFFASYNEIDVVLDTYPFNGGTTTCFATYMGVPVVSLYGQSLTSRMGLSILSNLGVPQLAVATEEEYIAQAVALARAPSFLADFRATVRDKFAMGSIGNGRLYAAQFEAACRQALAELPDDDSVRRMVPSLPVREVIRRAYLVLAAGNSDGADRILAYARRHHPDSGLLPVFEAARMCPADRPGAIRLLLQALPRLDVTEAVPALINLISWLLDEGRKGEAWVHLERLGVPDDAFDRLQADLFAALRDAALVERVAVKSPRYVDVVLVGRSLSDAEMARDRLCRILTVPEGWRLSLRPVVRANRVKAYREAMNDGADIVVLMQAHVEVVAADFLSRVASALESDDVVAVAGCRQWRRLAWRMDAYASKAAGLLVRDKAGVRVTALGESHRARFGEMAVLDGALLACKPACGVAAAWDEDLVRGEVLMEEVWTHAMYSAGASLAVNRELGVVFGDADPSDPYDLMEARQAVLDKLGFDAFAPVADDEMLASVPVSDELEGLRVLSVLSSPR